MTSPNAPTYFTHTLSLSHTLAAVITITGQLSFVQVGFVLFRFHYIRADYSICFTRATFCAVMPPTEKYLARLTVCPPHTHRKKA